jgi:N-acetylneuraminic acid mutarotase
MAYDSSAGRVIVFGGIGKSNPGDDSDTDFNDTWAYDPATNKWTELRPSGIPPVARHGCSMAYDPSRRRMVMFGGTTADAFALSDTWEYDCAKNTWSEVESAGVSPSARLQASLVYCGSVNQVLMLGGLTERAALNDAWAYTR